MGPWLKKQSQCQTVVGFAYFTERYKQSLTSKLPLVILAEVNNAHQIVFNLGKDIKKMHPS